MGYGKGKVPKTIQLTHPDVAELSASLAQKATQNELETEKSRINNLVANAGNTDGNAELLDIRVDHDGTVYPTAGETVRAIGEVGKSVKNTVNGITSVDYVLNDITGKTFTGSSGAGTTRVIDFTANGDKILTEANVQCNVAGTIKIKFLKKNTNGTFDFVKEFSRPAKVGINKYVFNEPFYKDYVIGVYSADATTGSLVENPGTIFQFISGDAVGAGITLSNRVFGTRLGYSFTFKEEKETLSKVKYMNVEGQSVGIARNGLALSAGLTRIMDYKYTDPCVLKEFNFYATSIGDLVIKSFTSDNNIDFILRDEVTVSVNKTGLNSVACNLPVYKNGYVGVFSSNVGLTYDERMESVKFYAVSGNVLRRYQFSAPLNTQAILIQAVTVKTGEKEKKNFDETVMDKQTNIKPLYLPTMDKTNQPFHPSVIHIPGGFNGYEYWMAETALPTQDDVPLATSRYECPHVHCSKDGLNWEIPNGLVNPIDDLTQLHIDLGSFFSDTHIVYKGNQLEVWYRFTDNNASKTTVVRKTSSNGITWSARETMIDFTVSTHPLYDMVRSPAIIWDGSKYKMWFVDTASGSIRNVAYSESADGLTWSTKTICKLTGKIDDNWHLDCSYFNGQYHLIIYSELGERLNYFISGNGIDFTFKKTLLEESEYKYTPFSKGLYRAALAWDGENYLLYISVRGDHKESVMLARGKTVETLTLVDGSYFRNKQVFEKGIEIVNNGIMSSEITLSDKGTSIGIEYGTEKVYIKKSDGTKIYLS